MVLQNKYKARASRRYNAARGGASDSRGRGTGRRTAVRPHDETSFPSLPGAEGQADKDTAQDQDEDGERAFGSDSEQERIRAKYGPRSLTSNAWRYQTKAEAGQGQEGEGDGATQAEGDDASEEEDPVDLSGLMERVARLDHSRTSHALSSQRAAQDALDADQADVDATLLHLLDRQRQRQQAQTGTPFDTISGPSSHTLTEEQCKELEREGRRLQEEKQRQERHQRRAEVLQRASARSATGKSFSLDIGQGRREMRDTDRPAKPAGTAVRDRSKQDQVLVFEEKEQERSQPTGERHEVDDFLDNLEEAPSTSSHQGGASYALPSSRDRNQVNQPPPLSQGKRHDDDQDFLDSIL